MRLVLVLILVLGVVLPAFAETIDLNLTDLSLPDAKPGFIVSLKEKGMEATLTSTLVKFESKYANLNLDVGMAPAINEPIAGLAFKFGDLSQYGIDFPLRKYFDITVGVYGGMELNELNVEDNDWQDTIDYGLYATIARITF